MAQLLLEFFSEEIPARMQARAESDLERLLVEPLKAAGLSFDSVQTFSGPRRIGLVIEGLPVKTEGVSEERKGPKVGAPDKAVEGFLRSAGLTSLDQCRIEEGKKGAFYIALIEKPGRETAQVIAEAIPDIVRSFPWPKSMKFGEGALAQRWVRPLQSLIALFDGQVIDTSVFGLKAGDSTKGHRILGGEAFSVRDFADYQAKLRENGVTLTRDERREAILAGARKVCGEAGLSLVEDIGLLEEVTGLVEHPVAILGDMDPQFLDLPPEVIQLTMKTHQKYFAVADHAGQITSKFVVIANQNAADGGKAIAAGNSRVLSARLSDARHFWDLDCDKGLKTMSRELSKVTFHDKLGTVADKVERVAALARELAPSVGANPELAFLAAKLSKADLVSQMVYEFPELQGVMGRYYALQPQPQTSEIPAEPQAKSRDLPEHPARGPGSAPHGLAGVSGSLEGLNDTDRAAVADAIRDHYKPQGPSDTVPTNPVSAAVALADKLDTLVGFWAIDEKPTGSKDPFALRRAALGVIRVLEEGDRKLSVNQSLWLAHVALVATWIGDRSDYNSTAERFNPPEEKEPNPNVFDAPVSKWIGWDGILQGERGSHVAEAQIGFPDLSAGDQPSDAQAQGGHDYDLVLERVERLNRPVLCRVFSPNAPHSSWLAEAQVYLAEDLPESANYLEDLLAFFADRLKVHLKAEGVRHDVIDAVFALGDDDLVRVTKKSRALQAFLETSDGAALLSGYRRAANILSAEEKKGFDLSAALQSTLSEFPAEPQAKSRDFSASSHQGSGSAPQGGMARISLEEAEKAALMIEIAKTAEADEERALIAAIEGADAVVGAALEKEDFEAAMAALADLREPVDAFFEAVVVNDDRDIVRRNRLLLLSRIRATADTVADFSRLEGEAR